jgi:hypothetical protein
MRVNEKASQGAFLQNHCAKSGLELKLRSIKMNRVCIQRWNTAEFAARLSG